MSEVSFEQLLDEVSFKPLRTGEVVTGRVIDVKADEIILSIDGSKSEGIITKSEYSNDSSVDLTTKVQVGDEMEAKVLKVNDGEGMASLSYKRAAVDKGLKRLKEAFENKEVLRWMPWIRTPFISVLSILSIVISRPWSPWGIRDWTI